MKDKTTLWLANRLNQIAIELDKIEMRNAELIKEYDEIVFELWERHPNLEKDSDVQPKRRVRK